MIDSLIRWLPTVRRLDTQLRTLAAAKIQADDEIRRLRAALDDARGQLVTALADGCHARETVADWLAQSQFGRPIFTPFTQDAEMRNDFTPQARRPHGRDLVRNSQPIVITREVPDDAGTETSTA